MLYSGDSLRLKVILTNPYPYDIDFNHRKFPVKICMAILKGERINIIPIILREPIGIIRNGQKVSRTFTTLVPELSAGSYSFGICLQTDLGPSINGSFHEIRILKR
jgi:hypothetical protein